MSSSRNSLTCSQPLVTRLILEFIISSDSDELYGIRRQSLTLLEMSSIFLPENWSFTFYEGLRRHPDAGFRDREVTELGCGNGWISIALADRYSPRKVKKNPKNPPFEFNLFPFFSLVKIIFHVNFCYFQSFL